MRHTRGDAIISGAFTEAYKQLIPSFEEATQTITLLVAGGSSQGLEVGVRHNF